MGSVVRAPRAPRTFRSFSALLALSLAAVAGCQTAAVDPADLVLRNGKVVTVDPALPEAQALAVRDGTILAIGSDAEIAAYIGEATEVIDLAGRLAVPGLIEGHGHYLSLGQELTQIDLRFRRAIGTEIVAMMVPSAVDEVPSPGVWVVGSRLAPGQMATPEHLAPALKGLPDAPRPQRDQPRTTRSFSSTRAAMASSSMR